MFRFGSTIQVLPRTGNTFGTAVAVAGVGVAPREQGDPLVDVWPPMLSGRTVYAPFGSPIHRGDRLVIAGVTFDVDGEPAEWFNPLTGRRAGLVVQTIRFGDLFTVPVLVESYLGSGSLGPVFASAVEVLVFRVQREVLEANSDASQEATELTLRTPAAVGGVPADQVFSPESIVTIGGRRTQVVSVEAVQRFGFTRYVEVVCK